MKKFQIDIEVPDGVELASLARNISVLGYRVTRVEEIDRALVEKPAPAPKPAPPLPKIQPRRPAVSVPRPGIGRLLLSHAVFDDTTVVERPRLSTQDQLILDYCATGATLMTGHLRRNPEWADVSYGAVRKSINRLVANNMLAPAGYGQYRRVDRPLYPSRIDDKWGHFNSTQTTRSKLPRAEDLVSDIDVPTDDATLAAFMRTSMQEVHAAMAPLVAAGTVLERVAEAGRRIYGTDADRLARDPRLAPPLSETERACLNAFPLGPVSEAALSHHLRQIGASRSEEAVDELIRRRLVDVRLDESLMLRHGVQGSLPGRATIRVLELSVPAALSEARKPGRRVLGLGGMLQRIGTPVLIEVLALEWRNSYGLDHMLHPSDAFPFDDPPRLDWRQADLARLTRLGLIEERRGSLMFSSLGNVLARIAHDIVRHGR